MTCETIGSVFVYRHDGEEEVFVAFSIVEEHGLRQSLWMHPRSARWGFESALRSQSLPQAVAVTIRQFLIDLRIQGWNVGDWSSAASERDFWELQPRLRAQLVHGLIGVALQDFGHVFGERRWEMEPVCDGHEELHRELLKMMARVHDDA